VWSHLPGGCTSQNVTAYTCVPSPADIQNYTVLKAQAAVTDATNTTLTANVSVILWPQLNANANAFPLSGHSPLTVSFFSNATGGWLPLLSDSWLTDRGVTLTPNQTYAFTYIDNAPAGANTHLIQFWANDTFNISIYHSVTITVLPPVPELGANITSSPASGLAEIGQTAVFNVTPTGGLGPYSFNWTAEPGCTADGAYFNCTPKAPGYVYATVKVTDSLGKSYSPKPASVDFLPQLHVTTGFQPAATCGAGLVNLTAQPSGGDHPYTVTWTFPDGTTATGATVSESFAKTDTNYSVSVNVTDALGASVVGAAYVQLTSCGSTNNGSGGSFPLLPVLGGAIVLIAVVALLAFLMMRRRGGGDASEHEDADLGPTTPAAPAAEGEEGEIWGAEQRPPEEVSDYGAGKDVTPIPADNPTPTEQATDDTWPPTSK